MNSLMIFALIVSIALIFAVYCGIKLFDIGSTYISIIRHASIPLGIILSFIAVVNCALPTIGEEVDKTLPYIVIIFTGIALMIIGFVLSLIYDIIAKHKDEKGKDKDKKSLPFAGPFVLDLLGGIITAGAVGCSFAIGASFSMMAATAIALFLIMEKVALVYRYKDDWSRKKIIIDIAVPLLLIPIVSALMTFICAKNATQDAILVLICCGYLVYHSAFHIYFIAKKLIKR